jgi:hypothetical protein
MNVEESRNKGSHSSNYENAVFSVVKPQSSKTTRHFGGTHHLCLQSQKIILILLAAFLVISCLSHPLTLKMEPICFLQNIMPFSKLCDVGMQKTLPF